MAISVLYLHGVGQGVTSDAWYAALTQSLDAHGIQTPSLQSKRIIRPSYNDLLNGVGVPKELRSPRPTQKHTNSKQEQLELRAKYARAQSQAIDDLPGAIDSSGWRTPGRVLGAFDVSEVPLPHDLGEAKRYLKDENLRFSIMYRVIESIGTQRDLVIVAHSLGSLVALDLLAHLPPSIQVHRLITIGSPLGALGFLKSRPEVLLRDFPFHQVDGWINLFSPFDLATYGAGLASAFPAASDVRISGGSFHAVSKYLAHPAVAKAIADAMRPVAPRDGTSNALDLPLDPSERDSLDAVIFADQVSRAIKGQDKRTRYGLALLHVRQEVGSQLIQQRREHRLPVPHDLVRMAQGGALPKLSPRAIDEALMFTIVNATGNPVAPFEIKAEDEQLMAVAELWQSGYGYLRSDAQKIVRIVRQVKSHMGGDDWNKLLLGAVGIALVAAGPVGLMLAAPVGLAGGAAITASLAAFGPGGMVGGMALAGGLVGAGSAFTAGAAMPSGMSEAMVRTQVVRCLAYAKSHHVLALPPDDYRSWHYLNSWRDQVAAETGRLSVLSDENAPTMKSLRTKLDILDKGLRWMVEEGLSPALASAE